MKKLVVVSMLVLGLGLNAQTLNDKGLYINDNSGDNNDLFNGNLFNGVVSNTQNNIKSEFTVKEGVVEGPANYYYASGKLMETGTFTKGQKDQKWIRYDETGSVSAIAFYNMGKKTGTWLVFDEKNNKRFEMNYDNGDKTGIWTSWDENGAVVSTKDYSKLN